MLKKKIITKKQFLIINKKSAVSMKKNFKLKKNALKVFVEADKYRWIHQNLWMGEPVLNLPEDLFCIQDIIFKTKPDYIIETVVAWGGSSLFYSMLLDYFGGKKYIGIDTFIPKNVLQAIKKHKKLNKKIKLIKGDSTSKNTILKIRKIVKKSKKIMVILDSYHTHQHVLKELNLYSNFVKNGNYLICGDTIVNDIPDQKHRPREWNRKNNPQTALNYFLKKNKNKFKVDYDIYRKLLFSNQPKGYLISI